MSSEDSWQKQWRTLPWDIYVLPGDHNRDLDPDHDSDAEFAQMMAWLTEQYQYLQVKDRLRVRMIGLCFANPSSSLGENDIFPNIEKWHERHRVNVDFYLPGCHYSNWYKERNDVALGIWDEDDDYCSTPLQWFHSPNAFNAFRREIEGRTRWRYSGGNDLILVNAWYREDLQEAEIDFANAVVCRLDSMKDAKAISSVDEYMESLFRFAEESPGWDPAWGFSERKFGSVGGSPLWRLAVSLLPGGIVKYAADPKRCSVKFVGL